MIMSETIKTTGLIGFINRYWILLLLIAIKLVLQFTGVNPIYELHRDEFLHLDQSNHLAFGFISVPPLTSIIAKIIFLLGGSMFWIRFMPALFGALTIVFTWLIVELMGGSLLSKIFASCALLFSVLMRLNLLFQPNSFEILVWIIIFYLLIIYVQSEKPKWLFILAFVIAIGIYNKYNLVFLLIGLAAGFLLTSQRKLFLKPAFWIASALIIFLILPNLVWQAVHHFPVVHHMKALKETQLDNNSSMGFLRSQVFFFFASLPLTICALIGFLHYRPFKAYRFIGICFLTAIALFTYFKAKDYYALGLYPVLLAFGSIYIEANLSHILKYIIIPLLIGLNLTVCILMAKLVYPILSPVEIRQNEATFKKMGLLRWEDGKNHLLPQDFADMIGWKEMAEKALAAYKLIPANESANTLIFCDNYGQTGALNYYNRNKMPEAYSFNTDYIYWLPHLNRIQNILLVGNKPSDKIISMFSNCRLTGVVENELAREKGTGIYLLTGGNEGITDAFYKLADKRKESFQIF
jgi:Dolichyl-phosphate-mannose-protein mannosyltransferase